jgi:hypothetical protein
MSKKERLVRKKYMGLWRRGPNLDTRMMAMFPIKATGYVIRRMMNTGGSSQGWLAKPSRMSSSGWLSLISTVFILFYL